MKRILFILILCLVVLFDSTATNKWKVYLAYHNVTQIEETPDKVFAVADGSLFSYSLLDNSIRTYYKGNVLNENDVVWIQYSRELQILLVVYRNGNIDLLSDTEVYNLPYLKDSDLFSDKTVKSVSIYNQLAYLSGSFGVIVIDLERREFLNTFRLPDVALASAILGDSIYVAGSKGLFVASLRDNLSDYSKWKLFEPINDISNLLVFDNSLCYSRFKEGVYRYTDLKQKEVEKLVGDEIKKLKVIGNQLFCIQSNKLLIIDSNFEQHLLNNFSIEDITSLSKANQYWVAKNENGIQKIAYANEQYEISSEEIKLNEDGPYNNTPYHIVAEKDRLLVLPGGKSASGVYFNNLGIVMDYNYHKWNYTTNLFGKFNLGVFNFTDIAVNPLNRSIWYVASCSEGVFKFVEGKPAKWFNHENSPLESVFPNKEDLKFHYIRAACLAFDQKGNLWVASAEANNALAVLDTDGKWHSIFVESLKNVYTIEKLFVASSGIKWITVPRVTGQVQLTAVHNGVSLDGAVSNRFEQFYDQDGNSFVPSSFTAIAEDKEGILWIGTDKGPICFRNSKTAIFDPIRFMKSCMRVKLPLNDGTNGAYYFLDNVKVTAIAIDAGNRKWFGTENNGVFVLSDDGKEVIHQFNTQNSPLLSNSIYSIAINDETGEVFIGTHQGLLSYKGEATSGKENFSSVYAYPNPVRLLENPTCTITGLMNNSNIKITDINGSLIYQTRSVGGQVIWNCKNAKGDYVKSGIYLIFGVSEDGKKGVVCKVAVVN